MEFPVYQVPFLGHGMTIALDAVIHVIYSHGIAIGLFTMIAWSELQGWRRKSVDWDCFARDTLKVTVLLITSFGAITGVGIWFTISGLEPRGTGSMLRIFFWPWFSEWLVFLFEVVVLLVYFFTWERWSQKRKRLHIGLGFAYVALASLSAFFITGILGFMLTPDTWPWSGSFWAAFFNPSFPPQLLLRLAGAYAMGGIFALAFLMWAPGGRAIRKEAMRPFGLMALVPTLVCIPAIWWYLAVVPPAFKTHAVFAVVTSYFSQVPELFWLLNGLGLLVLLALASAALLRRAVPTGLLVIPAILVAAGFVSEFERVREFIRGPYVMPGYMYANEVLLSEQPLFARDGLLRHSAWQAVPDGPASDERTGAYLFARSCSVCHTTDGFNNIRKKLAGRPPDAVLAIVRHTEEMVPFMPPFAGSPNEEVMLARFLYRLTNGEVDASGLAQ